MQLLLVRTLAMSDGCYVVADIAEVESGLATRPPRGEKAATGGALLLIRGMGILPDKQPD